MQPPCYNTCFTPKSSSSLDLESIASTSCNLHPHTQFTNHEALPSLEESYVNFTNTYPSFSDTSEVDRIRAQEYHHLNHSNICFDYTGYGLFSYAQVQSRHFPKTTSIASTSSCPPPLPSLPYSAFELPLFVISHKPVNLHGQLRYGGQESELESKIRERIMGFMNISEAEYTMVFTANEVSAFKLIADSFQFESDIGELLTVYDHESEALDVMVESSKEQGARVSSAEFTWPNLGINCRKLKKMIISKRGKRKRGLFVLPLHSRVTGAPYSYVWMSLAQENGWYVLVDACALGPKEMDTLGLTLFKPDFMVCSFYKVFGENPSGFGCLFVKKSSISSLKESCNYLTSMGIVSLFPQLPHEEFEPKASTELQENESLSSEIVELNTSLDQLDSAQSRKGLEIECRGLDHADSVGLILISCRGRCLITWLVNALMSLQHPHPQTGLSLIRIYGPKMNSHRGPVVAFNVFDWKGEKVDPGIVQKLADRNNVSLSCGVVQNMRFSDKNEQERERAIERRVCGDEGNGLGQSNKTRAHDIFGIKVVTAALGFLTNFEDVYRLWSFLSRFLDADFVEKERWRYMALNQKTIDI